MYIVKRTNLPPAINADWDDVSWSSANVINIAEIRPESSSFRPKTECKLLHDDKNIYGLFRIFDRYVRAVAAKYNDSVCKDSCVEFFVEPPGGRGYMNFEFSGNGIMLLQHIRDCRRTEDGFADFNWVSEKLAKEIEVFTTLPKRIEPEITEELTWRLGFKIPLSVFEAELQTDFGKLSGQEWRANLYKCAGHSSHPHWISYAPLTAFNFHSPQCFAPFKFE
ncbi:MAG: carbohydrate-binding family 9-like protein [Victivallales bacterium]|jgi:hypothetical protein|nr:carbohydrate-binding family 9-like protein [Victivallales bacterium]